MKSVDRYLTLSGPGEATIRELGSRFIGHALPMTDETGMRPALEHLAREHPSASHHCFAWILGDGGERFRANDDGEPSGTAGRPILRRIQAAGLTYCGVIVVRYFGGTLLGRPGLIQAYGEAARLALEAAPSVERIVMERFLVTCGYDQFDALRTDIQQAGGRVVGSTFTDRCTAKFDLPIGAAEGLRTKWMPWGIAFTAQ